jgi:hypothetical protein
MSQHHAIIRICDICRKRVSDEGEVTYGGHVHAGWFTIERTGGSTTLRALKEEREWDVCSLGCLKMLAAKLT